EISLPITVNSGVVKRITHAMEASSARRIIMAAPKPRRRAFCCCSLGSFATTRERKIILSIPSTISRIVSVPKAIHALGSEIHANIKKVLPKNENANYKRVPERECKLIDATDGNDVPE